MMAKNKEVEFTFKPTLKALRERYRDRKEALKETKTTFTKISIFLDRWVQKNFKSEGDSVGGWQPFKIGGRRKSRRHDKRFNVKKRRVKGSGIDTSAKLLQDTGRLRASFLPFASKKIAGVGSDLPYSKTHNKGINVPQRRVLPVDKEVEEGAEKIMNAHVKKSINK